MSNRSVAVIKDIIALIIHLIYCLLVFTKTFLNKFKHTSTYINTSTGALT
jgi:rRNA pseudouridine-1189 N-methylase Emg1 (Nep1/Mra1 family)